MAKTTERHIADIRDIFPMKSSDDVRRLEGSHAPVQSSNSTVYRGIKASKTPTSPVTTSLVTPADPKTSSPVRPTGPKTSGPQRPTDPKMSSPQSFEPVTQASNSEVFYMVAGTDARMSSMNGGERTQPTAGYVVKVPATRKKRLAPEPPSKQQLKPRETKPQSKVIQSKQQPKLTHRATGENIQVKDVSLPKAEVTGSGNNRGQQLDRHRNIGHHTGNTGQTSSDIKSKAKAADDGRHGVGSEVSSPHSAGPKRIESLLTRAPMSVPLPPMNGGGLLDNNIEYPYGDPDNATCAASCLSDSGTASSSSGYTSESIPDPLRLAAMNGTGPLVEAEGDDFEEDECTLDFGEEDEAFYDMRNTRIYKEYQGEDFSHYLKDDLDSGVDDQNPVAPPRKPRYHKHKDGTNSHMSTSSSNTSTMDNGRKKGIKQRFSQMFTLSRQHKGGNSYQESSNRNGNIQNFSFADSKIGVVLGDNDTTSEKEYTPEKKFSDVGLPKSWWNTDTLSARSLRNNSEVMVQKKRANSVPDILDSDFRDFNSNHDHHVQDFESSRKARMYDSKGRASAKKGFWSKLTKTLKKKDKSEFEQNKAINPLTSQEPAVTDVRL